MPRGYKPTDALDVLVQPIGGAVLKRHNEIGLAAVADLTGNQLQVLGVHERGDRQGRSGPGPAPLNELLPGLHALRCFCRRGYRCRVLWPPDWLWPRWWRRRGRRGQRNRIVDRDRRGGVGLGDRGRQCRHTK